MSNQAVTVRIDTGLHRTASAFAAVLGMTFREFVESSLNSEINGRIQNDTSGKLAEVRAAAIALARAAVEPGRDGE